MKIFQSYTKYLVIFVVYIVIACSEHIMYSIDELLAAPEQIEIDGREYILQTYLWRDFIPGTGTSLVGSPLYAVIYVFAIDSLPFPSSLDADFLWVINEDVVWETELIDANTEPQYEFKLKKQTKEGGPKWGSYRPPFTLVDVVVRIVHDDEGPYLLRAADQVIHPVY